MKKEVLYINRTDKEKTLKIKMCAALCRINFSDIADTSGLPEDAEFMMLKGFTQSDIEDFLRVMKKMEVYVPYKCVETENNKNWPLIKLYEEIKEEHEYMKRNGRK